ncbi:MAG: RdgB/HAM1 family non-canonical purine NTP pyrophosphatase [Flavobacteriaceae bacterium]|nr:RdgB/HAM1 family non-canonical purine NTP pyrophosphatase [Flavobacteriaceae bacterium]
MENTNSPIVFASHNENKVTEIKNLLTHFHILDLNDIGFHEEIEETGQSFKENAEIKADAVAGNTQFPVFADDSGLVVPILNFEPGIFSFRYAGTGKSEDNIEKLLKNLENSENRDAYFMTVICLVLNNQKYFFEGRVMGKILPNPIGNAGFGYDPVFLPDGYHLSFAQMSPEEKNQFSHRAVAVNKMRKFLLEHL